MLFASPCPQLDINDISIVYCKCNVRITLVFFFYKRKSFGQIDGLILSIQNLPLQLLAKTIFFFSPMVCMTDVSSRVIIIFKDTYTYMCYGKTICTRLQWRNVFEIRHYVIFKENKENRTSTDIGPTMAVSKKSSEEEEVEVIEHAERQMLQMEGVEGGGWRWDEEGGMTLRWGGLGVMITRGLVWQFMHYFVCFDQDQWAWILSE